MRGIFSKIRQRFRPGEFFPFEAFDQRLPYFHHHHNCGFPGKRRTERTVELAIADWWLKQHPDAVEVGAVTPYYWPARVRRVIDPADCHEALRTGYRSSISIFRTKMYFPFQPSSMSAKIATD